MKDNLVVRDGDDRMTTGEAAKAHLFALENVQLTARKATTNIGVICDPDPAEPWIIAMAAKSGYLKTLDYSARWAIEPMFSDFVSMKRSVENNGEGELPILDRVQELLTEAMGEPLLDLPPDRVSNAPPRHAFDRDGDEDELGESLERQGYFRQRASPRESVQE